MKVDKRLSEEFGTPLPEPVSYQSSGESIVEWFFGHLVPAGVNAALLAAGALIGHYYPPAFWWFLGVAGFAALCIAAMFVVVLIASSMDDPMDGGYPGS
jgi:hypothetical protein